MTELLERLFRRQGNIASGADDPRYWRRVPRINVLPHQGATSQRSRLIRAALVAIVLLEIGYLFTQVQGKAADLSATEVAKTQLQQVQKELSAEQDVVEKLQASVDEARKRVVEASGGYEQITASQTNWYAGAANVLATRTDGVEFTSISTEPGGVIVLRGTASDLGAMSRFQSRLREVSESLRLQNVSFESAGAALGFTATLKVVQ